MADSVAGLLGTDLHRTDSLSEDLLPRQNCAEVRARQSESQNCDLRKQPQLLRMPSKGRCGFAYMHTPAQTRSYKDPVSTHIIFPHKGQIT